MNVYILSDQMIRQLLTSPRLSAEIPELVPYAQQRTMQQNAPRRGGCGCGGRTSTELRVIGTVKEALLKLPVEKAALAKQIMGVNGALRVYYRQGHQVRNKVI
jgi:hypothetical protein